MDTAAGATRSESRVPRAPRLLVVADAAIADVDELPPLVRGVIEGAGELYVVTPTLPGRLDWLASQTNPARHAADERLDRVLGQLSRIGADAHGHTGDEDILTAFADAVAEFGPDHILIALRDSEHANWQERGLVAHVRERFDRPLTTFSLDEAGHVSTAPTTEPRRDPAAARAERVDRATPAAVADAPSGRRTERDGLTVLAFFAFASLMMVGGVALAGAIDSWWALASVVVVDFILTTGVMMSVFALLND